MQLHSFDSQRGLSGFTLIELLIAMALFSIMSLLAWRGMDVVLQSQTAVDAPGRAALELAAAWTQLETDLQAARAAQLLPASPANAGASVVAPYIVASARKLAVLRAPADCAGCWQGVVYDIGADQGISVLRRRATATYADVASAQAALGVLVRASSPADSAASGITQHALLREAADMVLSVWRGSADSLGAWQPLGAASAPVFPADTPALGAQATRSIGAPITALKVDLQLGRPWDGRVTKVVVLENRW